MNISRYLTATNSSTHSFQNSLQAAGHGNKCPGPHAGRSYAMAKSIKIVSLGCSKNTVDSEKLLKQLQFAGYLPIPGDNIQNTDIVIVNTCGFINDAKEESVDTILELAGARKRGDIGELYVMGCLSERYRDQLIKEIPEVDRFFGVNREEEILSCLAPAYKLSPEPDRILSGPPHYAYLKVSEGCNRNCAFCAIPGIKGRYRSTPVDELVREAKLLAAGGVRELILIAQDLTYYGRDLYGRPALVDLIRSILDNTGIDWLRLHYLYPGSIPGGLLELIKHEPRICNYIDLPVQHISDKILSAMKRGHSEEDVRNLLEHIRNLMPGAAIRTTLITGYPGETENDFNKLLDFVREFRFDRLGVFTYSHEEDTRAHSMFTDNIPGRIKRERAARIMELQQEISLAKNLEMVGKEIRVLIDRKEGTQLVARSESDSPEVDQEIFIGSKGAGEAGAGDFCTVRITSAGDFELQAEII